MQAARERAGWVVLAATVYAARDSELVRMSRKSFELMLERDSRAAIEMSSKLAYRLAYAGQELRRTPITCMPNFFACVAQLPPTAPTP